MTKTRWDIISCMAFVRQIILKVNRSPILQNYYAPDIFPGCEHLAESQYRGRSPTCSNCFRFNFLSRFNILRNTPTSSPTSTRSIQSPPSRQSARYRLSILPYFSRREQFRRYASNQDMHVLPFPGMDRGTDVRTCSPKLCYRTVD